MDLPNVLSKKVSNDILCGNCNHIIIQDFDSGKWYHQNRDTKDECLFLERNIPCKCGNANPFAKKKLVVNSSQEVEVNEPEELTQAINSPVSSKDYSLHAIYSKLGDSLDSFDLTIEESIVVLEGFKQERQILYTLKTMEKRE